MIACPWFSRHIHGRARPPQTDRVEHYHVDTRSFTKDFTGHGDVCFHRVINSGWWICTTCSPPYLQAATTLQWQAFITERPHEHEWKMDIDHKPVLLKIINEYDMANSRWHPKCIGPTMDDSIHFCKLAFTPWTLHNQQDHGHRGLLWCTRYKPRFAHIPILANYCGLAKPKISKTNSWITVEWYNPGQTLPS